MSDPRADRQSDIRTTTALVLARFTLADAQAACGLDASTVGDQDRCPSCRRPGVAFVIDGHGLAAPTLTDVPARASRVRCAACGFSGTAVGFVMVARRFSHVRATLNWIEGWLEDRGVFLDTPLSEKPAVRFGPPSVLEQPIVPSRRALRGVRSNIAGTRRVLFDGGKS